MVQTCLTHVEAFSLLLSQMLEICSGSLRCFIEGKKKSIAAMVTLNAVFASASGQTKAGDDVDR